MTNFNHMSVFVYVTFLFTYVKTVRKMLLSYREYEIMRHSFGSVEKRWGNFLN